MLTWGMLKHKTLSWIGSSLYNYHRLRHFGRGASAAVLFTAKLSASHCYGRPDWFTLMSRCFNVVCCCFVHPTISNGVFSTCRGMIKIACALRHHPETAAAASCSQVHQYFDQLLLILNVCIVYTYKMSIYISIDNYNVPFELILMDWKLSQLFWLGL